MSKKKTGINFFPVPEDGDPLSNIVFRGLNIIVNHGMTRLSREAARLLGVSGITSKEQIDLQRAQLRLDQQKADLYRVQILSEKQFRMYDLKIEEKEIEIDKRRRLLESSLAQQAQLGIPIAAEVIQGALEVIAVADGLSASPELSEGYVLWLDSFESGKVIVILGRRGSGKTALAAKMGEYNYAVNNMPFYWIGLPEQARSLLPSWVKMTDSIEKCPLGSFILIDEAGIQYMSLAFNTDRNKLLRSLLQICRHRLCSLVFAVQSSRDVENSVIRQCDSVIFKEPSLHQPDSERQDIKAMAKQAAMIFKDIPREKRRGAAFVFDDDFQGLITSTVPSFWSEGLSHIYAHLDFTAIEQQGERRNELQTTITQETMLLSEASLDRDILELKKQGYGIERIAKALRCTTHRVRKCLDKLQ